jgi:flagellar basal body-associated protein FliL
VFRVFLIILMVLAMGGTMVGVFAYLRSKHEAAAPAETAHALGVEIPLEPIFVPIKREDDASELRTYVFVLDVKPGFEELAGRKEPELRDAFTKTLTALAARADSPGIPKDRLAKLETIENISYLKAQLRETANETLDPGARKAGREPADLIRDVFIRSMIANVT